MPRSGRTRAVGIKDVAARAGVSQKTVTNVVHNRPNVAPQTRARVRQAIDALGYRPSVAGRVLQSGHSRMIALAVPRVDNPYIGALAHVIQAAAVERGYRVMIDETRGSAEAELEGISGYRGSGVEAVIFEPYVRDRSWLTEAAHGVPTVLLSDWIPESHADTVMIDNETSAREVVDLLVGLGCRRLALVGSQPHTPTSVGDIRVRAAERAARDQGLHQPAVVPLRDYSTSGGQMIASRYRHLFDEADAAICTSDLVAVGLIKQLTEDGVAIPDDIMVVGWDDIPAGEIVRPSLTTVQPDRQALAATAIDAAIERIEGYKQPGRRFVVPHRVVRRQSVGFTPPASEIQDSSRAPDRGMRLVQPSLSHRDRDGIVEALTQWRIASLPSREIAVQLGFSGVEHLIDTTTTLAQLMNDRQLMTVSQWGLARSAAAWILDDRLRSAVAVDDPAGPFDASDVTTALKKLDVYLSSSSDPDVTRR